MDHHRPPPYQNPYNASSTTSRPQYPLHHSYHSYEQDEGESGVRLGKRTADHFEGGGEQLYHSQYHEDETDTPVKDEESTNTATGTGQRGEKGGTSSTTGGGGGASRKNRTAAPPLKRGSACMLCRKRKLRCDGLRPKCGTCLRLSHECVYGDPAQEKIHERTRELEERVRSLEAELEVYRRGETPAPNQQNVLNSSTFAGSSSSRPNAARGDSFPALNMPANDASTGYPSPHLNSSTGPSTSRGHFPNYPPQANYPHTNLQHPHQHEQAPLDSPYLSFSASEDPNRLPPQHTPQHHHHDSFGRADSEAFPLPPPLNSSTGDPHHGFLSRLPIPNGAEGDVNGGISPGGVGTEGGGGDENSSPINPHPPPAHLQSFPFPMNPTPQLSDLINPQHYSPVAGGPHNPYAPSSQTHLFNNNPNDPRIDGSPSTQHHLSPGYPAPASASSVTSVHIPSNANAGYSGLTLPHNPLSASTSSATTPNRQPFDHHSALASPERNLLSLGSTTTTNGIDAKDHTGRGGGEVIPTMWGGADLPDIDLMVELANIYFSTVHQHLPFLHRPRFLYTLRHPASLSSPPSLSLIFSVLAIAAAYHDDPTIRAMQTRWYSSAREKVEVAIQAGIQPSGGRIASLTVEMVQALCLLALLEIGQSDHQRGFLSIGQAVRIAAMLGLHRMDEDRLSERCGTSGDKRLRPPALHELPRDGVLLEECRRTMCAVIVLDRFEQGCVGWPSAISESDLRILLPCDEVLYDSGTCTSDDNPLWWPVGGLEHEDIEVSKEGNERKKVGTFAWLCRAAWVGGRIQLETYRPAGPPAGGPWNKNVAMDPLFSSNDMNEMDKLLEFVRTKLGQMAAMKASQHKGVDGPVIMTLLLINCLFVNLHHLRAATGLSQLPFDPTAPIFVGTAEYSMQRCWEAIHSLYEIVSQLAGYENAHTSVHRSRINTFTSFVPYSLYCVAFPAKFSIGDWTALVNSRDRIENVPAHLSRTDLPRGDDVFPPSYFEQRLKMVDALCDAMERVGTVWPIGHRFASMVSGDRIRLAERTYQRSQQATPAQHPSNGHGGGPRSGGSGSDRHTPVAQTSQHLHPSQQQQQHPPTMGYQTSPTLQSDNGY